MFLVEFYRDLLMAAADNQLLSPKSILDKMLIRYQWLEGRRIMTVKSNGGGFVCPYGYDYNGQEVVFSPLLLFDRVAYHVLMYMTQVYTQHKAILLCCPYLNHFPYTHYGIQYSKFKGFLVFLSTRYPYVHT